MKRLILLVILLVVNPIWCLAAPEISQVNGTLAQGSSITIVGTGFGTRTNPTPLLWASFEASLQPSALGRKTLWDYNENNNIARVSGEGWAGSGAAKSVTVSGTYTNVLGVLGVARSPEWSNNSQKWYVFKRLKRNVGPFGTSENWKSFRTTFSAGSRNLLAGESNSQFTLENSGGGTTWWGSNFSYQPNEWQTFEILARNQSSEAVKDGYLQYRKNNQALLTTSTFTFKTTPGENIAMIYPVHEVGANVGTWPDSASKTAMLNLTARAIADDVYVDDEWSRVFLGNAGTYAECTSLEIQIPQGWSATSIAASANTGAFTAGQQVYLYVFDAENSVNSAGYGPLTIQASGAPDTAAPTCSTFTLPETHASLSVPISALNCTDAVGVTGYYLSESNVTPTTGNTWIPLPSNFSVSGQGDRTVYVWARDAAGNISTPINATVTVTLAGAVQFTNRAGKSSTFTQGSGQVRFTQ